MPASSSPSKHPVHRVAPVRAEMNRFGTPERLGDMERFGLARDAAIKREAARRKVSNLALDRRRNAVDVQQALGRINPHVHLPNDRDDPLRQLEGVRKNEVPLRKTEKGVLFDRQNWVEGEEGGGRDKDRGQGRPFPSEDQHIKEANKRRLFANPNLPDWAVSSRRYTVNTAGLAERPDSQHALRFQDSPGKLSNPRSSLPASLRRLANKEQERSSPFPFSPNGLIPKPDKLHTPAVPEPLEFLGSFDAESYLSAQRMLEGDGDAMKKFQFNQVASDATPPNRLLRDVRHHRCVLGGGGGGCVLLCGAVACLGQHVGGVPALLLRGCVLYGCKLWVVLMCVGCTSTTLTQYVAALLYIPHSIHDQSCLVS